MNIIKRILKNKRYALATIVLTAGIALIPAMAFASFGPDRPTFTMAAGGAPYVTFNSITDNPVVGNERPFHTVRDATAPTTTYADTIDVNDNQELVLRVYFHNNANETLNLTAQNTRVRFTLPATTNTSLMSIASISADNANPGTVTDTAGFTNDMPFSLEYIPGSALLRTNVLNDVQLSDSIITSSGAQIGYSALNGQVPGCLGFSGWVTIKVRVHVQVPAPEPFYFCDILNVTALPNRRVDTSVVYVAINGATLSSVSIDWGDLTAPSVSTTSTTASHTYQKDGMYGILATLNFNVGGSTQTDYCWTPVTITTPGAPTPPATSPPTPPPGVTPTKVAPPVTQAVATPGKATTLPNTGPGSIAAIFAGVSAFAGAGHYFLTRRFR